MSGKAGGFRVFTTREHGAAQDCRLTNYYSSTTSTDVQADAANDLGSLYNTSRAGSHSTCSLVVVAGRIDYAGDLLYGSGWLGLRRLEATPGLAIWLYATDLRLVVTPHETFGTYRHPKVATGMQASYTSDDVNRCSNPVGSINLGVQACNLAATTGEHNIRNYSPSGFMPVWASCSVPI